MTVWLIETDDERDIYQTKEAAYHRALQYFADVFEIKEGTVAEGIFAPIAPVVAYDLINTADYSEREYFKYVLDTRGIEMENEGFDLVMCIILLAIILFLTIKIIVNFILTYLILTEKPFLHTDYVKKILIWI